MNAIRLLYITTYRQTTTASTVQQAWRTSGISYKDDVESCLHLLHLLDRDTCAHSKLWFAQNILELTETSLEITIGSGSKKYSILHKSWLRMYSISRLNK
jgi:hypothetical protein